MWQGLEYAKWKEDSMGASCCSVASCCVRSSMGILYIRVSFFRINIRRYLTWPFRTVIIIFAGWANIINGLIIQRRYQRSITLKSLWAMGFGKANADMLISYNQANTVRSIFTLTAIPSLILCVLGKVGCIRQFTHGQYCASGSFSRIFRPQWSFVMYAGSSWVEWIFQR